MDRKMRAVSQTLLLKRHSSSSHVALIDAGTIAASIAVSWVDRGRRFARTLKKSSKE